MDKPQTLEEMDAEANAFAMELLMPANFVRREVKKMGGIDIENEKKLKRLADKFRVSTAMMAIRLGQLSRHVDALRALGESQ